jgi:nicotinamide mononucleotide adenylyltransferase
LEYALLAKERCRRLLVGVTNPDPTWIIPEAANADRHTVESNPFTYFERALMLRDSLLGEGLEAREFIVAPFPIQNPELCRHYVPEVTVHFVRVYSGWEEEKVRRLKAQGFAVEVLGRGEEKAISGREIRRLIRAGLAWEHLVPTAAVPVIRDAINSEPRRLGAPA